MKKITIVTSVLALVISASSVFAADIVSPQKDEPTVTISSQEKHKNLYTAGGNVSVDSVVEGDLVVAGSDVSVNGEVKQDLLAAAGTLKVNGVIGDDARIAGGNVTVAGKIQGDLIVAGGNVTLTDKSEIVGDLVVAGGTVKVNGPVRGSVRASSGNLVINSEVAGPVSVRSGQLTFGEHANAQNKINYKGQKPAEIQNGAQVGTIEFSQIQKRGMKEKFKGLIAGAFIIKLLAWIFAGLLLIKLRKRLVQQVLADVTMRTWRNVGWGLVGLVGIPLLSVVVLLLLVGYVIAFAGFTAYVLLLTLASIMASVVLGALVIRWLTRSVESVIDWQAVVIGVVLWHIIGLIPVLGWIVTFLVTITVFGSLLMMLKDNLVSQQSEI